MSCTILTFAFAGLMGAVISSVFWYYILPRTYRGADLRD